MKHILSMLIRRSANLPWWELRTSEGNPASEKVGHYILPALLTVIRNKLKHVESDHEKTPVDPR